MDLRAWDRSTMDQKNNNNDDDAQIPRLPRTSPRDGLIDFSTYSTAQLNDLQYGIDRETHPRDFQNLITELAGRTPDEVDTAGDREYTGRFTSLPGIVGSIQAACTRLQLHGKGALRFETDDVVLRGWQRTWLGAPLQAEIHIDSRHIRNVVREERWVRFESHPDGARIGRFQFKAESADAAAAIADRLPQTRTPGVDAAWMQLREFDRAVQLAAPRTWVAPMLTAINLIAFACLAFVSGKFWIIDPDALTRLGSNLGLLTIEGQWWRLFASMFLHAGAVHLVLNMWSLWGVGRLVERLYGAGAFLFIYVCAGLIGSLSSIAWNPFTNSVGASGAIFGVFGACLVFLARRDTCVPARIVRAHGLSTLAFVLFNLISGMGDRNIDNAAHFGGLIGGSLFGWILARPLNSEIRIRMAGKQVVQALCVVCLALGAGAWQIHALRSSQSIPERYWIAHQWLPDGQARVIKLAGELQMRASAGQISESEFARVIQRDVIPFWRDAESRLVDEPAYDDAELDKFAVLVMRYVRHRHDAAQAVADALNDADPQLMADSQRYTALADRILARLQRLEMRAQAGRLHSLSESRYAKAVRNVFARLQWKCTIPADKAIEPPALAGANDGLAGRVGGGCAAQRAFETADYAALNALLHPVPKTIADLDDGDSSLRGVMGGLEDLFASQGELQSALSRLADWRETTPAADGPDLVEALLFRTWAWSARGSGTAKTIAPQQWAAYALRIEMAVAALEDAAEAPTLSPVRHELTLLLGLDQGKSAKDLRAVFDAGHAEFPEYYALHRNMLRALMPRWGGAYGAADNFIQEMVRKAPGMRGPETYARLYSYFSALEGDETDLFKDAYANWRTMKQGFDDMLNRYPNSQWLRNTYAVAACQAGDAAAYRIVRTLIGANLIRPAWTQKFSPERCDERLLK